MDFINPDTVAIIVGVLGFLSGGWGFLAQRKTAKENKELHKQQVEAQAYDKARMHYDAIIEDLSQHIAWLKSELAAATEENARLKERIEALEKTVEALRSASVIVIESPRPGGE